MAAGVVVSCGSPGGVRFSSGSLWSRRDVGSPLGAPESGEGGRPADAREQQVRAGVVAQLDGGLAHLRHRHRALGEIRCATGAYSWRSAAPYAMRSSSGFGSAVDASEHERRERCLEGAAHDEAFVGAPGDRCPGADVFGIHADLAAARALVGRERPGCRCSEGRPARGQRRSGDEGASIQGRRFSLSGRNFELLSACSMARSIDRACATRPGAIGGHNRARDPEIPMSARVIAAVALLLAASAAHMRSCRRPNKRSSAAGKLQTPAALSFSRNRCASTAAP